MLSSGNIGKTLEDRADEVSLFYSRNGGIKWHEVRKGRYITEIGNHGTAILAAPVGVATNSFIYTVDDGSTWDVCKMEEETMDVTNIRVSAGWDSTEFLLYGRKGDSARLVHIDMIEAYEQGKCTENDFELWTPTDEHGECFMGHKTQYKRRLPGRKCYLDEEHEHETQVSNCSCSTWDYECAECFYRPSLSSPCVLECDIDNFPLLPKPNKGDCDGSNATHPKMYTIRLGYQLVDEDTCDTSITAPIPGGLISCEYYREHNNTEPGTEPEPNILEPQFPTFALAISLVIVVFSLFLLVIYLYRTNHKFYLWVSGTIGVKNEGQEKAMEQVQGQTLVSSDEDLNIQVDNNELSEDSSSYSGSP